MPVIFEDNLRCNRRKKAEEEVFGEENQLGR